METGRIYPTPPSAPPESFKRMQGSHLSWRSLRPAPWRDAGTAPFPGSCHQLHPMQGRVGSKQGPGGHPGSPGLALPFPYHIRHTRSPLPPAGALPRSSPAPGPGTNRRAAAAKESFFIDGTRARLTAHLYFSASTAATADMNLSTAECTSGVYSLPRRTASTTCKH